MDVLGFCPSSHTHAFAADFGTPENPDLRPALESYLSPCDNCGMGNYNYSVGPAAGDGGFTPVMAFCASCLPGCVGAGTCEEFGGVTPPRGHGCTHYELGVPCLDCVASLQERRS